MHSALAPINALNFSVSPCPRSVCWTCSSSTSSLSATLGRLTTAALITPRTSSTWSSVYRNALFNLNTNTRLQVLAVAQRSKKEISCPLGDDCRPRRQSTQNRQVVPAQYWFVSIGITSAQFQVHLTSAIPARQRIVPNCPAVNSHWD